MNTLLLIHLCCLKYTKSVFLHSIWKSGVILPTNGGLAVGWTLCCSKSLTHLCLSKPQGQPTDLKILGELSDFLQINAFLAVDCLLGFYNCERIRLKIHNPVCLKQLCAYRGGEQVYILLTSWPTFAMSPQVMGTEEERVVVAVFSTDGCGAMTTGD